MDRRSFLLSSAASVAALSAGPGLAQVWNSYTLKAGSQGILVPPTMFGANILAPHDGNEINGVSGSTFATRISEAGVRGLLRWPGGGLTEGERDSNGFWIPGSGVNITGTMVNVGWRTSLDQFLAYCHARAGISPVIVLPTIRYLNANRVVNFGQIQGQITAYVNHIIQRTTTGPYPNAKVAIWEIGNEFDVRGPNYSTASLTPREYSIIAEEMMHVVRAAVPAGYGSIVAVQGAPLNHAGFEPMVTDLQGWFRTRLQNRFGTGWASHLPELLTYHPYPIPEDGANVQSSRMAFINHTWGNIPLFIFEWNANNAPWNNQGGLNPNFNWGMERAFMQLDLFRAMLANGAQHATFWAVQGNPSNFTSMYRFEGSSNERMISGAMFNWMTAVSGMRVADVTYSGSGSAVRVFGYCRNNRRRAVAFICGRGAVAQDIRLIFENMQGSVQSYSVQRMFGPWGAMATPTSSQLSEGSDPGIKNTFRYRPGISQVAVAPSVVPAGVQFEIPIRVTSTHPDFGTHAFAYEVIRVELIMTS